MVIRTRSFYGLFLASVTTLWRLAEFLRSEAREQMLPPPNGTIEESFAKAAASNDRRFPPCCLQYLSTNDVQQIGHGDPWPIAPSVFTQCATAAKNLLELERLATRRDLRIARPLEVRLRFSLVLRNTASSAKKDGPNRDALAPIPLASKFEELVGGLLAVREPCGVVKLNRVASAQRRIDTTCAQPISFRLLQIFREPCAAKICVSHRIARRRNSLSALVREVHQRARLLSTLVAALFQLREVRCECPLVVGGRLLRGRHSILFPMG